MVVAYSGEGVEILSGYTTNNTALAMLGYASVFYDDETGLVKRKCKTRLVDCSSNWPKQMCWSMTGGGMYLCTVLELLGIAVFVYACQSSNSFSSHNLAC